MRSVHFVVLVIAAEVFANVSAFNSSFFDEERRPRENGEEKASGKQSGFFSIGTGDACISPEGTDTGTCLTRQQCSYQGGRVVGNCGVFAICCALSACDIRTNAKNSVFTNPPYSTSQPYTGLECSYTVEINNDNVCQMRLDFDSFSLAQPTISSPPELSAPAAYSCVDDIFQVINLQSFSEIIPPLCGENSGQHIYARVNASLNSKTIRLSFKLADRTLNTALTQAVWRIRVTQLECYNTMGIFREPSLFGSDRNLEKNVEIREARSAARDQYLIAPDGCLQYYPDRSGIIESFNYNRGLGPYPGNLHYSTCFRRGNDVCGIKLTAAKFELGYVDMNNSFLDTDCQVNPYVPGDVSGQDFLFIPQGESVAGLRGDKWCGVSAENEIITTSPPGPLYIYFNSDNICVDRSVELGYRFSYNVLNNCR